MCMNIDKKELSCKCCGLNLSSEDLLSKLRVARFHADTPFVITSGTRCVNHNKAVGGSPTSSHMLGLAADISVSDSAFRYQIVAGLITAGFTRILIYKTFIHVDVDQSRSGPIVKLM